MPKTIDSCSRIRSANALSSPAPARASGVSHAIEPTVAVIHLPYTAKRVRRVQSCGAAASAAPGWAATMGGRDDRPHRTQPRRLRQLELSQLTAAIALISTRTPLRDAPTVVRAG